MHLGSREAADNLHPLGEIRGGGRRRNGKLGYLGTLLGFLVARFR